MVKFHLQKYFITFEHVFSWFLCFYDMKPFTEEQNIIFFPRSSQQLMTWLLNVKQKDTSVFVYFSISRYCTWTVLFFTLYFFFFAVFFLVGLSQIVNIYNTWRSFHTMARPSGIKHF